MSVELPALWLKQHHQQHFGQCQKSGFVILTHRTNFLASDGTKFSDVYENTCLLLLTMGKNNAISITYVKVALFV